MYSQWLNQNQALVNQALAQYQGPTYRPPQQPQIQTAQVPQGGNNALGMAQTIYGGVKSLAGSGDAQGQTQVQGDAGEASAPEIQAYEGKDDDGTGLGGILGLVGKLI